MTGNLLRLSFAALMLLLCSTTARNQSHRRDGNWWRDTSEASRISYMTGFFDGMALGHKFSYWGVMEKDKNDPSIGKIVSSYDTYLDKYLNNVTNSQLADGVDKFYSDYRNRRIMVYDTAWIVLNEISGKSDADMKKMIENWRKSAATDE